MPKQKQKKKTTVEKNGSATSETFHDDEALLHSDAAAPVVRVRQPDLPPWYSIHCCCRIQNWAVTVGIVTIILSMIGILMNRSTGCPLCEPGQPDTYIETHDPVSQFIGFVTNSILIISSILILVAICVWRHWLIAPYLFFNFASCGLVFLQARTSWFHVQGIASLLAFAERPELTFALYFAALVLPAILMCFKLWALTICLRAFLYIRWDRKQSEKRHRE